MSTTPHQSGLTAASIVEVGALTRALAERYETIFQTFRTEAQAKADEAVDLAQAARAVSGLLETVSASYRAHFPNASAVDCAAGCAACCHLAVATPPGVAEMIGQHINATFSLEVRQALITRLQGAASAIAAAKDPERLRLRCPLLGADERCTIYSVRPISCRAFTSPSAALCHRFIFEAGDQTGVAQDPALYRFHRDATAALQRTARLRNLPAAQQMLAPALIKALGADTGDRLKA
ncbi:YkgJ family cysteine cluster protein [Caulobacter sp. 73W]|uniref:YkgJ family cysteine cluster protein n=1 Tax=Caulobacter sp. 73W TaxID=3161137 RepID=A0AB39KSC0_9CAUL